MEEYQREVGKGRYGRVIVNRLGDAVKIIPNQKSYLPTTSTINEAAVAQLVDNPYVIRAKGVQVLKDDTLIVYPLAEMDLQAFLMKFETKLQWTKKLLFKVGLGLAYLHNQGIVHGDIKATNILMFKENDIWNPKIADYGSASWYCVGEPVFGLGTYIISPPEVLLDETVIPQSDVWSYGVLIVYLLANDFIFYNRSIENPFSKDNVLKMIQTRLNDRFKLPVEPFVGFSLSKEYLASKNLSDKLIDLLDKIFVPHEERPTIFQVLQDPFFDDVRSDIPERLSCQEIQKKQYLLSPSIKTTWGETYIRNLFIIRISSLAKEYDLTINIFLFALDLLDRFMKPKWVKEPDYMLVALAYASAFSDIFLNLPDDILDILENFANTTNLNFYPQSLLDSNLGNQPMNSKMGNLLIPFVSNRYLTLNYEELQKRLREYFS